MSSTTSVPKSTTSATATSTAPNPTPSQSNISTNGTDSSSTNGTDSTSAGAEPVDENGYPEQRHSGAVGYGPNYQQGVGFSEKIQGLKEQVKGKITKNPDLVEHGKERRTGVLKKKEEEEDVSSLNPSL